MVVIPACRQCQQKWDLRAEYFRNSLIAMIDKGTHPVANKVLEGSVIKSLERNEKAIAALFRNTRQLPRTSPNGIITGYGLGFEIDWPRFAMIPEKLVRGLFFHKSGVPMADTHVVRVFPGNQFWDDEGFQNLLAAMESGSGCGDDVFTVRCTRDRNDPFCAAWLLVFYRQFGVFAWTSAKRSQAAPSINDHYSLLIVHSLHLTAGSDVPGSLSVATQVTALHRGPTGVVNVDCLEPVADDSAAADGQCDALLDFNASELVGEDFAAFDRSLALFLNMHSAAFLAIMDLAIADYQVAAFSDLYARERVGENVAPLDCPFTLLGDLHSGS